MRLPFNPQLILVLVPIAHATAMLLAQINLVLNGTCDILSLVLPDVRGDEKTHNWGVTA